MQVVPAKKVAPKVLKAVRPLQVPNGKTPYFFGGNSIQTSREFKKDMGGSTARRASNKRKPVLKVDLNVT